MKSPNPVVRPLLQSLGSLSWQWFLDLLGRLVLSLLRLILRLLSSLFCFGLANACGLSCFGGGFLCEGKWLALEIRDVGYKL
jgi:hypothetical protein